MNACNHLGQEREADHQSPASHASSGSTAFSRARSEAVRGGDDAAATSSASGIVETEHQYAATGVIASIAPAPSAVPTCRTSAGPTRTADQTASDALKRLRREHATN